MYGQNPPQPDSWEPAQASGRLGMTAGANPGGVFTSDLSVSEYTLLGEAGFEPLGFVLGSSVYHIGVQAGKWSQNVELGILSQAMYHARDLRSSRREPTRPASWRSAACRARPPTPAPTASWG